MSIQCCHTETSDRGNSEYKNTSGNFPKKRKTIFRRIIQTFRCIVPGAILVLLPKCPVCLAAWVSVATGFGISMSAAGNLRMALIVVCVGSLIYFALRQMWRKLTVDR